MFSPKFILFTCINLIIFAQSFSDVQPHELHLDSQNSADTPKISEKNLDYEQRPQIQWVDPHDIFVGMSAEQLKELIKVIKTPAFEETSSNPTVTNKNDASAHTDNSKAKISTEPVLNNSEAVNMPKEQKGSCILDSAYLTRWVKMLLYRIEKESDNQYGAISFALDSTIIESLKDIANSKLLEVSAFDGIMSTLLAHAVITRKESFTWSHTYLYYSDTLWMIIYSLSIGVFVFLLVIMKCNYCVSIPFIIKIEPQRTFTGSRVEEVSTSRQILTEAICDAASTVQNESVETIFTEDSTGLPKARNPAKAIQYDSSDGAQIYNPPIDPPTTTSKVIEEELVIKSGYFDARKSLRLRHSEPEIDVNVKKSPKKTTLPSTETSPKRLSVGDHSNVGTLCNANSMDTTKDASSSNPIQLASNNSGGNYEVEVSNLPESLSDSFEVLPTDDDNDQIWYCNKGHAVLNCDTSLDLLQEMHASCKFCN